MFISEIIRTFCFGFDRSHSKVADCFSTVTWSSRSDVIVNGSSVKYQQQIQGLETYSLA